MRRAVHVSFSLSLLYYLIPDPLPLIGAAKAPAAVGFALFVSLVETGRVYTSWDVFLLRDYERHQPAAYFWLGLGCCLALVFFPPRFAVLTILGVCFADPVIGEVRETRFKEHAMAAGAATWLAVASLAVFLGGLNVNAWLLLAGAGAAVVAEAAPIPYVDDDFLMNMVPLVTLRAVGWLLGA